VGAATAGTVVALELPAVEQVGQEHGEAMLELLAKRQAREIRPAPDPVPVCQWDALTFHNITTPSMLSPARPMAGR
jgi:hypothetical protein